MIEQLLSVSSLRYIYDVFCPYRCIFCHHEGILSLPLIGESSKYKLTYDELRFLFKNLKRIFNNTRKLTVTGASVIKDLDDLVKRVKILSRYFENIDIVMNSLDLLNLEDRNKIIDIFKKIYKIKLSFHSFEIECFKDILNFLSEFNNIDKIHTNIVYTKENYRDVLNFLLTLVKGNNIEINKFLSIDLIELFPPVNNLFSKYKYLPELHLHHKHFENAFLKKLNREKIMFKVIKDLENPRVYRVYIFPNIENVQMRFLFVKCSAVYYQIYNRYSSKDVELFIDPLGNIRLCFENQDYIDLYSSIREKDSMMLKLKLEKYLPFYFRNIFLDRNFCIWEKWRKEAG